MAADSKRTSAEQRRVQQRQPPTALQDSIGSQAHGLGPAYSPALLGDARLAGRGNGLVRIGLLQRMQQTHGNRAVQRFMQRASVSAEQGRDVPTFGMRRQIHAAASRPAGAGRRDPAPTHAPLQRRGDESARAAAIRRAPASLAKVAGPRPTVQRYVVLNKNAESGEAQYTTQQETGTETNPAKPLFPSQKQTPSVVADTTGPMDRYTLRGGEENHTDPPLRVADDGMMAIEYVTQAETEPRAFYATDSILADSNRRLKDIGATTLLRVSSGNTIRVPVNPDRLGAGTQRRELKQVEPAPAQTGQEMKDALNVHECNLVADKIMANPGSKRGVGIFESGPHKAAREFDYEAGGGLPDKPMGSDFAGIVAGTTGGVDEMQQAAPLDREVDLAVKAKFESDNAVRISSKQITENVSKYYAFKGTPAKARQEIDLRIAQDAPITHFVMMDTIRRYRESENVIAYGRMGEEERTTRSRQTGVNQFAMPEIGESFGAFSLSTVGHAPFAGAKALPGALDLSGETELERETLDNLMDPARAALLEQVGGFLKVSSEVLTNLKGGLWTWHYAAVVAKSGSDVVTLENYNRDTADKGAKATALQTLWGQLSTTYATYLDENITGKATDLQKITALEKKLKEHVGDLDEGLKKFELKEQVTKVDRWYFQMYGSPTRPQGEGTVDQSFHKEWTSAGGFVNPLTIRTGVVADTGYKDLMGAQFDRMLRPTSQVVRQLPDRYLADLTKAKRDMLAATTRVDVAKGYRTALTTLLPRLKAEVLGAKATSLAVEKEIHTPATNLATSPDQALATIDTWMGNADRQRSASYWLPTILKMKSVKEDLQTIKGLIQQVDLNVTSELTGAPTAPTEDVD